MGEAIERYSATYVPVERLVVASARELGDVAVAPERFALFSARQHARAGFPFRPFTVDTRIAWIEGREIATGRAALLPAELVYLGRGPLGERPVGYATSSGLACGDTVEAALARALLELLERDAFMIVWANRLSLPLLDDVSAQVAGPCSHAGLRYAAVDLSVVPPPPRRSSASFARRRVPGSARGRGGRRSDGRACLVEGARRGVRLRSAGAKLALLDPDATSARAVS